MSDLFAAAEATAATAELVLDALDGPKLPEGGLLPHPYAAINRMMTADEAAELRASIRGPAGLRERIVMLSAAPGAVATDGEGGMSDKAYFPPAAIRANVEAIRKMFKDRPGDDADMSCRSRLGTELGPAYIRAILGEVNRGVEPDIVHPALHGVIGWMLATSLASAPEDRRLAMLRRAIENITLEAGAYLLENNTVDPGAAAVGEVVGGHG